MLTINLIRSERRDTGAPKQGTPKMLVSGLKNELQDQLHVPRVT
jgi:hypothetical protein